MDNSVSAAQNIRHLAWPKGAFFAPSTAEPVVPESLQREAIADLERQRSLLGPATLEVGPLLEKLGTRIAGKHVPGGKIGLAQTLLAARSAPALRLDLILASPTACRELGYMVACVNVIAEHFEVFVVVHLLRWETTCDCIRPTPSRRDEFQQVATAIHQQLNAETEIRFEIRLYDLGLHTSPPSIRGPQHFEAAAQQVLAARANPQVADPLLLEDLGWTEQFYARQKSLSKYGPHAPQLDLAIRRGIGAAIAAEGVGPRLVLGSERKSRITKTYRLPAPAINVFIPACTT